MCKFKPLESEFKSYLELRVGAVDIDKLPNLKFLNKKADYYLANKRSIFEIKSITGDRAKSLEPWLQKRIETYSEVKNGMPVVFGTVSFRRLYEGHSNKDLFEKQLNSLAFRTLEEYIRNAKHQICDTKKALGCENSFGFLVILNEGSEFYETWFVYRMIQNILKSIVSNQPDLKIDGVWYINESTAPKRTVDVVFIHESNELEDITPNEILDELHSGWAAYRGYTIT